MGDVKLNSSGGGSVTLTTPSTASNLTVTLPSASGTLATTSGTGSVFTNPTINGFTGDTSVVNIGSGQFYKDTSGNVGIGTASPGQKLVVSGSGAQRFDIIDTGGATGRVSTANGTVYVGTTTNHPLAFFTNDSVKATLDSSGNLGLGVTPSAWGSSGKAFETTGGSFYGFSTTSVNIANNAYYNGTNWIYKNSSQASNFRAVSGGFDWNIAASGTAGNAISFTQAMTLDASGGLSVGNTSSVGGRFTLVGPSNGFGVAFIKSTTSGDVGNPAIRIEKYDNNSTTSQILIRFAINDGNSGQGQINANGASAAAFGSFSDSRLKENITALPNQLANICSLKPSEFDYKDGSGHQIGFIAQEMQDVYPDVVGEGEDGMLTITGWSKTEARLVKAIQELSAKNSELESRLAALEGK